MYNQAGTHILTLPHAGQVRDEMLSPDHDAIVTIDRSGACWLYELPSGVRRFRLTRSGALGAVFLPTSQPTVMIIKRRSICFKDPLTNEPACRSLFAAGKGSALAEVIVTVEGSSVRVFALLDNDKTHVWNLNISAVSGGDHRFQAAQEPGRPTQQVAFEFRQPAEVPGASLRPEVSPAALRQARAQQKRMARQQRLAERRTQSPSPLLLANRFMQPYPSATRLLQAQRYVQQHRVQSAPSLGWSYRYVIRY